MLCAVHLLHLTSWIAIRAPVGTVDFSYFRHCQLKATYSLEGVNGSAFLDIRFYVVSSDLIDIRSYFIYIGLISFILIYLIQSYVSYSVLYYLIRYHRISG